MFVERKFHRLVLHNLSLSLSYFVHSQPTLQWVDSIYIKSSWAPTQGSKHGSGSAESYPLAMKNDVHISQVRWGFFLQSYSLTPSPFLPQSLSPPPLSLSLFSLSLSLFPLSLSLSLSLFLSLSLSLSLFLSLSLSLSLLSSPSLTRG